jgi:nitrite reductase/ring-hydroxylating ferredoxin subunit
MELEKNWRKIPKTGRDRTLNLRTQPHREYSVFNNPQVLTESWYPVLPAKKLKSGQIFSFQIAAQRIVVFRDHKNQLGALDAFCPHMGADLANGKVVGERVQCYFHQWEYSRQGELVKIPCQAKLSQNLKTNSYPVEEKYGYIWVYAGPEAPYPVPHPPGLENDDVDGIFIGKPQLFVHHHVLMVSAIDIQHFASVHHLNFDFSFDIEKREEDQFLWRVFGKIPRTGWRGRLARMLLGDQFEYRTLFSGGSIVSINYGNSPHFRGQEKNFRWPAIQILWGCVPLENGTSQVFIFLVQKKAKNFLGKIANFGKYLLSILVLTILRDDDVKAYPHMRYTSDHLIAEDKSVAFLISLLDKVKVSAWSFVNSRSPSGSSDINC